MGVQGSNRNSTTRFSNRVADYVRHRPGYPQAVIECLTREFGLRPRHVVADIGSGTGIFARMLLEHDNVVYAVEPNDAMRAAAEQQLAAYAKGANAGQDAGAGQKPSPPTALPREEGGARTPARGLFVSVEGSAEATTLPDHSVDWIVAAQAFHWFDVDKFRAEACRILRAHPLVERAEALADKPSVAPGPPVAPGESEAAIPGATGSAARGPTTLDPLPMGEGAGRVAIIWNDRKLDTPFLQAYEQFLHEFGTDFKAIRHEAAETDGRLERFFGDAAFARRAFDNEQVLDEEGLRGRTLSASYMPTPDHPRRPAMLEALHALFATHQKEGRVVLAYETHVYVGDVGSGPRP